VSDANRKCAQVGHFAVHYQFIWRYHKYGLFLRSTHMITVISSSNSSSNNNDDERWRRPSLVSLLRLLLHVQGHRPSWSLERERETAAAGLKKKKFIIAAQSQSARTRPSGAAGRCKCKSASCWDNNSWPADWPPVWSAHGYWDDVCTFFNVVL